MQGTASSPSSTTFDMLYKSHIYVNFFELLCDCSAIMSVVNCSVIVSLMEGLTLSAENGEDL